MDTHIHRVASIEVNPIDSNTCQDTGYHIRKITVTDEKGGAYTLVLFADAACNLKIEL